METITTYHGRTEAHGFAVIVLWDARANRYVAQIDTWTPPPIAPRLLPGQNVPETIHNDFEEVTHNEIVGVTDLAKQRISFRCGKILEWMKA